MQWRLRVGSRLGDDLFAQLATRRLNGRAYARGTHRTAGNRGRRQRRIAELEPYGRRANTECLGRDLRHHRVRAGPDFLRARLDKDRAIRLQHRTRRRAHAVRRIRRRYHAKTDEPVPVTHRPGTRCPMFPPESPGGLPVAFAQMLAGKRLAGFSLSLGVVAQPKLERIHLQRLRELVHREFEREVPGGLARRALERRRAGVELEQAVRRRPVGNGVHHARHDGRRLREVLEFRRVRNHVVTNVGQRAIAACAERDTLGGPRSAPHRTEHLLAIDDELHRPLHLPRAHRRQGDVRPGGTLATEAAADKGRNDAHVVFRNSQRFRHGRANA